VLCGTKEIDLDLLLLGAMITGMSGAFRTPWKLACLRNLEMPAHIRRIRQFDQSDPRCSLPRLLEATLMFDATDPRDKFYALYGLTSTNLTMALLKASATLDSLEMASGKRGEGYDLPSWMPALKAASLSKISITS
jgi:hypothetical protein